MSFDIPNRLKRLHIESGNPGNDTGLAFQNTRVYRKAGYEVDAEVRVIGVGGVLVLASQKVDDGQLLDLMSTLSASDGNGLGESISTKVCASGQGGMQITVTGPARSIGLMRGQKMQPRNFGRDSGLVILVPDYIDAKRIESVVSMVFDE
jgi:hypothetical protein